MNRRLKRYDVAAPARHRRAKATAFRFLLILVCLATLSAGDERSLRPATASAEARAQGGVRSQDGLWLKLEANEFESSRAEAKTVPKLHSRLRINQAVRAELLRRAPAEFTKQARSARLIISLPAPDGTFIRFAVEESPIMEPALRARFPEIKTYNGRGIDDPTATTRFDWTPAGLHAIVLASRGTIFVEPETRGDTNTYVSYYGRDREVSAGSFQCSVGEPEKPLQALGLQGKARNPASALLSSGTTLRTYRLAVAATAEYTQIYGGGTVSGGLAAVTTTINLVNAVFERDALIRLVLVAGEASIIFTDTATDGYTHNSADTLLNENQSRLDAIIGSANYDIGHVLDGQDFRPSNLFYFQGRGNGRACVSGQKAKGVSILRLLEPSSTTAVWELLHEMGHQFGASHTFNGTTANCLEGRYAPTAYEPGSGSTIMGYRGTVATGQPYLELCYNEDLHSTDLYFHAASIGQILSYTNFDQGSVCGAQTDTGNSPPTVSAGPSYTIPLGTPFTLTAAGSDPEGDALTYCWEEFDLGAAAPPNTDDGSRPIFRSFAPTVSPARTFPQLSDILGSTSTFGESLPVTTRTMNFRVTARDNHPGGGGLANDATQVNVYSGSGPFRVTQPGLSTIWSAGTTQTVTWAVANTASAPVSCSEVRILLSADGGNTFPIVLASGVPNNGSATITVPNIQTSAARVKVEAVGNIFFDVSRPSFTIMASGSTTPPTLLTEASTDRAVTLDSVTFMRDPFALSTLLNFSADHRTRLMLFAVNLDLMPGEDASAVTAQAEDAAHRLHTLQVEYVGKVPGFDWLTEVVIRPPDSLAGAGDVWVSISLRGVASNKARIGIK